MSLEFITLETVKQKFPLWQNYLEEFETEELEAEDWLQQCAEEAEAYIQTYSEFTAPLTAAQTKLLMSVIRYKVLMLKHDGTAFKEDELPTIIRDFRDADKSLKGGLVGAGNVRITAKDRNFAPEDDEE